MSLIGTKSDRRRGLLGEGGESDMRQEPPSRKSRKMHDLRMGIKVQ